MNTNYYYATSAQARERKYSKKKEIKRYLKQRRVEEARIADWKWKEKKEGRGGRV